MNETSIAYPASLVEKRVLFAKHSGMNAGTERLERILQIIVKLMQSSTMRGARGIRVNAFAALRGVDCEVV